MSFIFCHSILDPLLFIYILLKMPCFKCSELRTRDYQVEWYYPFHLFWTRLLLMQFILGFFFYMPGSILLLALSLWSTVTYRSLLAMVQLRQLFTILYLCIWFCFSTRLAFVFIETYICLCTKFFHLSRPLWILILFSTVFVTPSCVLSSADLTSIFSIMHWSHYTKNVKKFKSSYPSTIQPHTAGTDTSAQCLPAKRYFHLNWSIVDHLLNSRQTCSRPWEVRFFLATKTKTIVKTPPALKLWSLKIPVGKYTNCRKIVFQKNAMQFIPAKNCFWFYPCIYIKVSGTGWA